MLEAGQEFENPRNGASLKVLEASPERASAERLLKPHTGRADEHLHLDFEQSFEVVSGQATASLDGEQRTLGPGERIGIPRGARHMDPYNDGDADLVIRVAAWPNTEFVQAFGDAFAHLMAAGKLNDQDELPLLQILVLAHATKGQSYGTRPPLAVQKATLPLIAALGRLRGYRPSYG